MRLVAKKRVGLLSLVGALLLVLLVPSLAFAHEKRVVGKYTFVVGFLNEPAYAGQLNSIDLTICEGSECKYEVKDGSRVVSNPINDAQKSLKVEVSTADSAPLPIEIAPRYAQPGKYSSYFNPSKVGAYTFHIFGSLASDPIEEKFTSGPNTFGEAQPLKAYPADTMMANMHSQINEAKESASTATTFGIAGIVVGILGLGLGALALIRKPKAVSVRTENRQPAEVSRG
ncbi:MAG: hypothetical protein WCS37_20270 [Chloroflexota bacterium]